MKRYDWYVYNRTLRAWLEVREITGEWVDYEMATNFGSEKEAQSAMFDHGGRFVCEVMRVER